MPRAPERAWVSSMPTILPNWKQMHQALNHEIKHNFLSKILLIKAYMFGVVFLRKLAKVLGLPYSWILSKHHGNHIILELSRFNLAYHSGPAKNSAPLLSLQLWVSCYLFTSH